MGEEKTNMEDIDREFENLKVRVVVARDSHQFDIGNRLMGPFKSGEEIQVSEWIAEVLADEGVVKFRDEDILDVASLSKTHWKETIPTSRQLPPLDPDFYCELRRLVRRLRKESQTDASKLRDYEKVLSLSKDIISCRIRKIASLAASPAIAGDVIKGMAREEKVLYSTIASIVSDWNETLLSVGISSES
jgi:hypothetical protein